MRPSLRALLADPAPLPRDCGYIHPNGPTQAAISVDRMRAFDRMDGRRRLIETIAGAPNLAEMIERSTLTADPAEIERIAREAWERQARPVVEVEVVAPEITRRSRRNRG